MFKHSVYYMRESPMCQPCIPGAAGPFTTVDTVILRWFYGDLGWRNPVEWFRSAGFGTEITVFLECLDGGL